MQIETRQPPLLNSTLRWFLVGMVLANVAGEMVFSLFAIYLAEMGASVADIGLFFSLSSFVFLFMQLAGGWVSDSIGRLRAIAIGSGVATLGYFGLVLAETPTAAFIAICFEYVSGALVAPSFGAFIAEQSSEATRGRVFSISQGIFMVVTVVGPPLAGFLSYRWGFKLMLLVAASLYLAACLLRIWMSRTAGRAAGRQAGGLSFAQFRASLVSIAAMVTAGGVLTWLFISDGVRDVASRLSSDLQPLYYKDLGGLNVEEIGLLGSIFGIATLLTTFLSGWVADRWGERVAIAGGFLLQACGIATFLLAANFTGFGAAASIFGFGCGLQSPAYNTLVSKIVPERMRGMAFGLFQSSIGLFSLPAPWLGAQLWTGIDPRLPFAISAAAVLLIIFPVWIKFRLQAKQSIA